MKKTGCLAVLGNVIWILTGGLISAIIWFLFGIILCITIIGIPFGIQCFKFASIMLTPFGTEVRTNFGAHPIANIIWLILCGWELAIGYIVSGIILCVTIIGIPFGLQSFKFTVLALMPFGAELK